MIQHNGRARSRVGWTFPAPHAKCNSLPVEHPIRMLTRCAWSLTRRVGTLRLVQLLPLCRKCSAHSSSAHRRRPWPQGRFQQGHICDASSGYTIIRSPRQSHDHGDGGATMSRSVTLDACNTASRRPSGETARRSSNPPMRRSTKSSWAPVAASQDTMDDIDTATT
jgi:hypothetical protein